MEQSVEQKNRYDLIDTLRGFSVFNMIAYHAIWDWNSLSLIWHGHGMMVRRDLCGNSLFVGVLF